MTLFLVTHMYFVLGIPNFLFIHNSCRHLQKHHSQLDKCTKAAILWFCFVTHAVEQLGNNLASAVLLPQLQNVYYAVEKFLMFCYLSSRFFFIWEILCYSATLLPQWQSFSHLINILLFCYSPTWVAEFFSFVLFCYSALKFFHQSGSVLVWIRLSVNL